MGKKKRAEKKNALAQLHGGSTSELTLNMQSLSHLAPSGKPRVLFAVGDADDAYTEGKLWRLVRRLKDQSGLDVVGVTADQETAARGEKLGLQVLLVPISPGEITVEDRIGAAGELIDVMADLRVPGSELFLWKVFALDDFVGSLQLFDAQPSRSIDADVVIMPLMCMDNNSKDSCGLYTWLATQARRQGIPVIGIEVSPLGNKTTLSHLPVTHYAVKTPWGRDFLIRQGIAQPSQVSVLKWEETYLLWAGQDEYTEAYLEKEARAREILQTGPDRFVVVIPHHVSMTWEIRNTLAALTRVPGPLSVVIRVHSATVRRQYYERDIARKTYVNEIKNLPHVVIDEQIGVGLLLQLADVVIAPFAGTTTERAALCRKPTIICQSMGEQGWQGEFIRWEPNPRRIPDLIAHWREQGFLGRVALAQLTNTLLKKETSIAA